MFSAKKIYYEDFAFQVLEDVYEPAEDSFLLAKNLGVRKKDIVLDMGTGCGILGILAAKKAMETVAIDVNPFAIRCASINAKFNNVKNRFHCIQSDLFLSLRSEKKFDLVLFNSPYLPVEVTENNSWIERSWAGGITGRKTIDRFISDVSKYVATHGRVLLLQSNLAGVKKTLCAFQRQQFIAHIIAEKSLPFFETIVLIEARKFS